MVGINAEGDLTRGGINGEGSCVVVVSWFQAVSNGREIACAGGIDDLCGTGIFINGCCGASGCEGWSGGVNGERESR